MLQSCLSLGSTSPDYLVVIDEFELPILCLTIPLTIQTCSTALAFEAVLRVQRGVNVQRETDKTLACAFNRDLGLLCVTARLVTRFMAVATSMRRSCSHNSNTLSSGRADLKSWPRDALDPFFLETPLRLGQALGILVERQRMSGLLTDPNAPSALRQQAYALMASNPVVCFVVEHSIHVLASYGAKVTHVVAGSGLVPFRFSLQSLDRSQSVQPVVQVMGLLARLLATDGPVRMSWIAASNAAAPPLTDKQASWCVCLQSR